MAADARMATPPNLFMDMTSGTLKRIFGSCESMYAADTKQFPDYSKYVNTLFSEDKANGLAENLQKAFELGQRLALAAGK